MARRIMVIPRNRGEIRGIGGGAGHWRAEFVDGSMLGSGAGGDGMTLSSPRDGMRVIAWSGSFAETEGGGLFDEDPRTWGPKGWGAFERACCDLGEKARGLLIRPHARHVVSDVPGCRRFLESGWAKALGMGLVYDPASMCSAAMVEGGMIADHLRRAYEAIELLPVSGLAAVVVAGPVLDGAGGVRLESLAMSGAVGELVAGLVKKHVPEGVMVLVVDEGDAGLLG